MRPSGKPLDRPPYPKMLCALHFYPDREYLDRVFFWNSVDLSRKLAAFQNYYNAYRVHRSLSGTMPDHRAGVSSSSSAALDHYDWRLHCGWLFQTPDTA